MKNLTLLLFSFCVLFTGCATVDPTDDYTRVHEFVESTTGYGDLFDPNAELLTDEEISAILENGLTCDEAVRLALLNNRQLQAAFASIGVAKADWVQSGLLKNPTLGMEILLPEGGGRSQIAATISQNIVNLWQLPIRKEMAQHQLDAVVLTTASLAGELVVDTKKKYYEAVAAMQLFQVARQSVELLERSHKAIGDKRETGTASAFDEQLANGQLLNGRLELRSADRDAANARRQLAKVLSLERDGATLVLTDALNDVTLPQVNVEQLIARARKSRLDLMVYEAVLAAAGMETSLERRQAFGDVEAGVGVERTERRGGDGNGVDELVGPVLSLEIPIFDQNQAQVARRVYLERKHLKEYEDAYLAVSQDVRMTIDALHAAMESLNLYRDELIPQAESSLELASEAYNAGQFTILGLIETQRQILDARRGLIRAQREAASSRAELDRVVGMPVAQIQ